MTVIFGRLSLHYFIMQDHVPSFPVTEEEFDDFVKELQKTKDDLIEAKLDIWEWEFDKEHIHTLEEIVHEQKEENESLNIKISSLKEDIQKQRKQIDELHDEAERKTNWISNLERMLRQERVYSMQSLIRMNLGLKDDIFRSSWIRKLNNLLSEINLGQFQP